LSQSFAIGGDSKYAIYGGVNAEAMRQTNTGLRFWAYVTTVPLTLLTLANLVVPAVTRPET
jgi:hypothetical protein